MTEHAPDLKRRALAGRRDSKVPGSPEWTLQTTYLAQSCLAALEHAMEEWQKVVAELEACRAWETFPPEKPYVTREAFFRAEFGKLEPDLSWAVAVLNLQLEKSV